MSNQFGVNGNGGRFKALKGNRIWMVVIGILAVVIVIASLVFFDVQIPLPKLGGREVTTTPAEAPGLTATGLKDVPYWGFRHQASLLIIFLLILISVMEPISRMDKADIQALLGVFLIFLSTFISGLRQPNTYLATVLVPLALAWGLSSSGMGGLDLSPMVDTFFYSGAIAFFRGSLGAVNVLLGIRAGSWYPFGQAFAFAMKDRPEVQLSVVGYLIMLVGILLGLAESIRQKKTWATLGVSFFSLVAAYSLYFIFQQPWQYSLVLSLLITIIASYYLTEKRMIPVDSRGIHMGSFSLPWDVAKFYLMGLFLIIIGM